jgi:hypothetical protein
MVKHENNLNELLPADMPNRCGGDAIDFFRHITGVNFCSGGKDLS